MFPLSYLLVAAAVLLQTTAVSASLPQKPLDCSAAVHKQFDFWVGEWDVVPNGQPLPAGQKPMTNVVTKEYGGCVVIEHWEGAQLTGSSFNIYDRTRGQWSQTWVDSSGGRHQYWGGLNSDGAMVFLGDVPLPRGSQFAGRRTIRLTFFPLGPDKVRQLSEAYMADGSWSVNYDLIYTRRPKK
jgi:hypothetical protein